jgi:phage baseplate assembly protein W
VKAISHPFRLGPDGHIVPTATYEELVRGQVIDALMTNQGERVMRALYGCDIQAALFDPAEELVRRDAASMIKSRLQQFVPRAIVRSVEVRTTQEPNVVTVIVVYRPSLYATDSVVSVPVSSSEFVLRQKEQAAS